VVFLISLAAVVSATQLPKDAPGGTSLSVNSGGKLMRRASEDRAHLDGPKGAPSAASMISTSTKQESEDCIAPGILNMGTKDCADTYSGSSCEIECKEGYTRSSDAPITCNEGLWTGTLPTCQAASMISTSSEQADDHHPTWALLASQNTEAEDGMFKATGGNDPRASFIMNGQRPGANAFMNVGVEGIREQALKGAGGKYRFKIVYEDKRGKPEEVSTIEWEQSSWLTEKLITGFACVEPDNCGPSSRSDGSRFDGLGASKSHASVLDGSGHAHGHWWNAVGALQKHRGGIPGWNGGIYNKVKLYMSTQA